MAPINSTSAASPNQTTPSGQSAQERAVGISVFVQPDNVGFSCVVKQRFTDFLVNEIQPTGQVVHLSNDTSQSKKRKREDNASTVETNGHDSEQEAALKRQQIEFARSSGVDYGSLSAIQQATVMQDEVASATAGEHAITSISNDDKACLDTVFGADTTSKLLQLYASVHARPHGKPRDHPTVMSEPIEEKSKRTEAHTCIRRIFNGKLETLTIQDQDHQSGPGTMISVKAAQARKNTDAGQAVQRGKLGWSELGGEWLHFTLYKENKDTMEVLSFLASKLKLDVSKYFSFAGTKDRRGVTVQRIAVYRVLKERIQGLNKLSLGWGWRLGGPWEYKPEGLELGMLRGNEFLLTLRDVHLEGEPTDCSTEQRLQHAKPAIEAAAQKLSKQGFLNYYGLQRFGTHANGTHVVGMKMLQGDLKGAIDAILTYDPSLVDLHNKSTTGTETNGGHDDPKIPKDDIARAAAIHDFKTGSVKNALATLPSRFSAEKGIMSHLGKYDHKTRQHTNENDFQGALMQIARNLRLMYVHAAQSFIWNTVAGKRWELFGDKVMEGDLVVVGEKEREENVASNGDASQADLVDEFGEPIIPPSALRAASTTNAVGPRGFSDDDSFVRARPLTKAEADSGRFTIFDLVLPQPGFDVEYPQNEIGKFYEEFMASEAGGGLDPHQMRRAWKDISLSGGYRKMMVRPLGDGVKVDIRTYSGEDEQMVQTDLEKLGKAEDANGSVAAGDVATSATSEPQSKIAVLLKMQLGSSQYATMALRELTRGGAIAFRPGYSVLHR